MSIEKKKQQEKEFSISSILELIIRRRMVLISVIAASFLISSAVAFLMKPIYEAYSVVSFDEKKGVDPLISGIVPHNDVFDLDSESEVLSKKILSRSHLEGLISKLNLTNKLTTKKAFEYTMQKLRKNIKVELKGKNMLQISYRNVDPVIAQKVVNTITSIFIEDVSRLKEKDAKYAIDFITEQLGVYRQKLDNSEKSFTINKIDSDMQAALDRRDMLQERLNNLQKTIPSQVTKEQNPVVAHLGSVLAELETQLAKLTVDATDDNPKVIAYRKMINEVRGKIDTEMDKQSVKESISVMNPTYMSTEQELRQVDMEIRYMEKKREVYGDGNKARRGSITDGELANLERNKKVDEEIYQMLFKQLEAAYVSQRLQSAVNGERTTVLEYAQLPAAPIKSDKATAMIAGIFLGFVIAFGFVFLLEYLDKSFKMVDDAKSYLQIKYFGSISRIVSDSTLNTANIAGYIDRQINKLIENSTLLSGMRFMPPYYTKSRFKTGISPQLIIYHDPRSRVSEEYRKLKINLDNNDPGTSHSILITSSVHGEGKTTTSSNLAVSYANGGKKTLLIDCDLRRGTVGDIFGIQGKHGLADVLMDERAFDRCLNNMQINNLSVMTKGTSVKNPSEYLESGNFEKLLRKAGTMYEKIILDSPPVLIIPDTCILAKYADVVLLIVQAERTRRDDVMETYNELVNSHAKSVGFAMTNVQYYMPVYLYDYYYGAEYLK